LECEPVVANASAAVTGWSAFQYITVIKIQIINIIMIDNRL
jgi:hypothetical protein